MTPLQNKIEEALKRLDENFNLGDGLKDFIEQELTSIATLAQEEARKEMVEDIRRIIMSESPMSETTSVTQLLEDIERYAKSKDITLSNNTQL